MKKILQFVFLLFLSSFLIACGSSLLDKYLNLIELPQIVENDFLLPRMVSEENDHFIEWSSNNEAIKIGALISQSEFNAEVTQSDQEVSVELTAKLELTNGTKKQKVFTVKVAAIVYITEAKLQTEIDKVYLGDTSEVTANLNLPKFILGNSEYPLTWTSSNNTVIEIVDDTAQFYKGKVNRQATNSTVTLTATVTSGPNSATKDITVIVIAAVSDTEYELMETIALAKAKGNKVSGTTQIKVYGTVAYTTDSGYFISDGQDMMYVYGSGHGRTVGEEVVVRGVWTVYQNMPQFNLGATAEVIDQDNNFNIQSLASEKTIEEINQTKPTALDDTYCTTVVKTIFQVEKLATGSYNAYKLVDAAGNFVEVSKYNSAATLTQIESLVSATKFYEGFVIIYCSRGSNIWDVIFIINSATEINQEVNDADKLAFATAEIEESAPIQKIVANIQLLTEISKYSLTVEWASNTPSVLSNSGVLTAPLDDTTVILTATIKDGSKVLGTVEITVVAKGTRIVEGKGEYYSHSFVQNNLTNGTASQNVTLSGLSWAFTQNGNDSYIGWDSTYGRKIQIGSANKPASLITFETAGYEGNIENIYLSVCGASGIMATLKVYVDNVVIGTYSITETKATEFEFTTNSAGTIKIEVVDANKAIYFQAIEINR